MGGGASSFISSFRGVQDVDRDEIVRRTVAQTGLSETEVGVIVELFDSMDVDRTGFVATKELTKAYGAKHYSTNATEGLARLEVSMADIGGNGKLSFEEFVTYRACQAKSEKTGLKMKKMLKARIRERVGRIQVGASQCGSVYRARKEREPG